MARTNALIPEQRRQEILQHLRRDHVLSYRQLTELMGVSHMTVRRDVAALAEQGRVIATPGGVSLVTRQLVEPRRAQKSVINVAQKSAIARAAAEHVSDSMTVYLDAGTTVQAMRPFLEERRELTVVTNDLTTVQAFLDHPSADIICIGGRVDSDNQSTIGRLAALTLRELSLDVAFLSCSSWDAKHGITTPVEAKVEAKQAAHSAAMSTVLLADSGKYGSFAKYRILGLDMLDAIITDDGFAVEDLSHLPQDGHAVRRVDTCTEVPDQS